MKLSDTYYNTAVHWIAENDDAAEVDVRIIGGQLTVLLVADVFDKDPAVVALDVLKTRRAIYA